MRLSVELKNYRCFPINRPARFSIGPGFTAFVGLNNAGKSTALRFFYEFRNVFTQMTNEPDFRAMVTGNEYGTNFLGVRDQEEVFCNQNELNLEVRLTIELGDDWAPAVVAPCPDVLVLKVQRSTRMMLVTLADGSHAAGSHWPESYVLGDDAGAKYDLRPWRDVFMALTEAVYLPAFRNAINSGAGSYFDLQIGSGFIAEWDSYKSGPQKANSRAALQLTEDIRRIFGFERLDINASSDNQALLVIIDGESYRLDEVGGGIAHFIIVLAYVATRRPAFVLIDEPELNLHPSLQLDFLTTLGEYASEGVVFTTHSLGLARSAAELIYSVRRVASGDSEVRELEATPRLSEFLGELSFAGYQELGFDTVVLVEGPTDVKVFQRLLRLYGAEHRTVLLSLGGSSLIRDGIGDQLTELGRLSPRIFAIIDSERSADSTDLPPQRIAFQKECEAAGISCFVMERRAVENYFTDRAVKRALGDSFAGLGPFELLRDVANGWAKENNWRVAGAMARAELDATDLGSFLLKVADTTR